LASRKSAPERADSAVSSRYASLFFVCGIDMSDNELIALELIHQYVEVLDRYFGNVLSAVVVTDFGY
jgi:hypothetical protein